MEKKIDGLRVYYSFCDGEFEISPRHACGSCGLTDEEWTEIDGYNTGVAKALKVMERMEARICELTAVVAILQENWPSTAGREMP